MYELAIQAMAQTDTQNVPEYLKSKVWVLPSAFYLSQPHKHCNRSSQCKVAVERVEDEIGNYVAIVRHILKKIRMQVINIDNDVEKYYGYT